MNARSLLTFLALILAALLVGCAAPQPYMGGSTVNYGYQTAGYRLAPEPLIPPGWANAYTPYDTIHNGRCYRYGFVQPTLDACRGMAATSSQHGFASQGQTFGAARPAGAQTRPIAGMSPETARMLLDELARRDNPCTAKNRTWTTSVGAFIGGIAAAIISRGDERVAAVGALLGAAGGNSEAVMSCQVYTDTRLSLMLVLDQYGCSGQVRKTNGVVTDDEVCDFRRPYVPGHSAPQIADRNTLRQAPAPAAVARPAPQPGRPSWLKPGEELPPK